MSKSYKDRGLLELAAKACGISGAYSAGLGIRLPELSQLHKFWWNPLTDDGDALRLAVKLGADIQPKGFGVEVWIFESRVSSGIVDYSDDPYAATRRAIVRAAAEIGRGME